MYVLDCRCTIVAKRPHRLVVRTSRCGRDSPGSTPGVVNFLPTSYTKCHKQVRLLVSSTFHRPRDTSLCLIRREPAQPGRLSARLLTLWAWPRALTVAALSVQSQTLSALGTKWPPHTEAHPAQPSDIHLGGPSPGPEYREPCIRHISTGWTLYLLASWPPRAPFCMGSCCCFAPCRGIYAPAQQSHVPSCPQNVSVQCHDFGGSMYVRFHFCVLPCKSERGP